MRKHKETERRKKGAVERLWTGSHLRKYRYTRAHAFMFLRRQPGFNHHSSKRIRRLIRAACRTNCVSVYKTYGPLNDVSYDITDKKWVEWQLWKEQRGEAENKMKDAYRFDGNGLMNLASCMTFRCPQCRCYDKPFNPFASQRFINLGAESFIDATTFKDESEKIDNSVLCFRCAERGESYLMMPGSRYMTRWFVHDKKHSYRISSWYLRQRGYNDLIVIGCPDVYGPKELSLSNKPYDHWFKSTGISRCFGCFRTCDDLDNTIKERPLPYIRYNNPFGEYDVAKFCVGCSRLYRSALKKLERNDTLITELTRKLYPKRNKHDEEQKREHQPDSQHHQ